MEEWKDVVGYEGSYQVSDQGRVRSLTRKVIRSNGRPQLVHGKLKKATLAGYAGNDYYKIWVGGRYYSVHRLVAEAFLPDFCKDLLVLHGPLGRFDNSVENLSMGTYSDNNGRDRRRDGTIPEQSGRSNPNARLTEQQIEDILIRLATGESQASIARDFPVGQTGISRIKRGLGYKDRNG